jgi:hypothetical protein
LTRTRHIVGFGGRTACVEHLICVDAGSYVTQNFANAKHLVAEAW